MNKDDTYEEGELIERKRNKKDPKSISNLI